MKKRPTMITLLVTAAVSLILGLLADYHFAVHTDFRSELVPELFFGMFPAMFVFLALWLFNKVRRLLEFPKKSVKPFVCLAFAVYAAEMIAFGFMGGDESARFQYHLKDLYFILFALCFSCLFLAILLIDVDESVRVVLFDDYTLRCRQTLIPNKENLPVTIGKLCTAETYLRTMTMRKHTSTILISCATPPKKRQKKPSLKTTCNATLVANGSCRGWTFLRAMPFRRPSCIFT